MSNQEYNSVRSITVEATSCAKAQETANNIMGMRWICDSITAIGNGLWRLLYRQITASERHYLEGEKVSYEQPSI